MFNQFTSIFLCIATIIEATPQQDGIVSGSAQNVSQKYCVPYYMSGPSIYSIDGIPIGPNKEAFHSFFITVSCPEGYRLVGKKVARCVHGEYIEPLGRCMTITNDDNDTSATGTGLNSSLCEVPDRPNHGSYQLSGKAHPEISRAYNEFTLVFKCNIGYELKGIPYVGCNKGKWFTDMPTCVPKYGYLADLLERGTSRRQVNCKAPNTLEHGTYVLEGDPDPNIPNAYLKLFVFVTCNEGYQIHGEDFIRCQNGKWSAAMPICGLPCYLKKDSKVDYYCENKDSLKICSDYVGPGEIVTPVCKDNITRDDITVMRCGEKGYFDHIVTCAREETATECGLVTVSDGLIIGGFQVEHGVIPWHAGIYTKPVVLKDTMVAFMQICGGTIVTSTSVISAAHCFWSDKSNTRPASSYAVAVGKIYRPWNDPHDIHAQKSDVSEIKIPILYFGSSANYQNDIAVLKLVTAIEFNRFVRPICLDFNEDIDRIQQVDGLGKVAGWGLKTQEGDPSQTLKAVFLPVVDLDKCVNESPLAFKPYITTDKICAGYTNGTAVCKGDSGGGLAFHRIEEGVYKYYLQGIVSTAPNYGLQQCNAFTWATFTSIIKHKGFIYANIK